MKLFVLALLFVAAVTVQGLEEEELDAEFEAADPNDDNQLDTSEEGDFETTVEQRDADPKICKYCRLCKIYKKFRNVRNKYANSVCHQCRLCNPVFYYRFFKRLPYKRIIRRITRVFRGWGRRRRSWTRRRRRRGGRRRRRRRRRRW